MNNGQTIAKEGQDNHQGDFVLQGMEFGCDSTASPVNSPTCNAVIGKDSLIGRRTCPKNRLMEGLP
jgi:hypothetical protein